MIRVLIVDDEEPSRSTMRRALGVIGGIEIAGEAANGVEALEAIAESAPDLVLLDIEMPGLNGFEVVQQLTAPPIVVFVTAYDEYAVRAFDANAIDYLLKPVQPERLAKAIDRARERLAARNPERDPRVTDIARQRSGPLRRIAARRGKRIAILPLRDINRIEIEDKLVFACTATERLLIEKTIGELETMLQPSGFQRIGRGELVNLEKVTELMPWFSGTWRVRLANGEERDVSRERAKPLKEAMGIE